MDKSLSPVVGSRVESLNDGGCLLFGFCVVWLDLLF
ncbi:hypothetical protein ISN44_As01g030780 [Arabidopsis suecica]|uniref:Uncharacterized protein n=1 Tax=Arabidopsis suecica TaxID=45249 RepID=A0A8T2HAR2_ARASU|nr:hypothetical protein ISN44_As01g030780 [Arabidopsis suecica]